MIRLSKSPQLAEGRLFFHRWMQGKRYGFINLRGWRWRERAFKRCGGMKFMDGDSLGLEHRTSKKWRGSSGAAEGSDWSRRVSEKLLMGKCMLVDIAITLHSNESWLYFILISASGRAPILRLEGMGRWGIQIKGYWGRARGGREWGCMPAEGPAALLCGEGSPRNTLLWHSRISRR